MPEVKVEINRDECIMCGTCWSLCPDVFEESPDDGKAQIVSQYRADDVGKGNVPNELEDCVNEAANSCPVQAISVERS